MSLGCLLWDHGLRVAWAIALRLLWSALVCVRRVGLPWLDRRLFGTRSGTAGCLGSAIVIAGGASLRVYIVLCCLFCWCREKCGCPAKRVPFLFGGVSVWVRQHRVPSLSQDS